MHGETSSGLTIRGKTAGRINPRAKKQYNRFADAFTGTIIHSIDSNNLTSSFFQNCQGHLSILLVHSSQIINQVFFSIEPKYAKKE